SARDAAPVRVYWYGLRDAFNDAQIALGAVAQHAKRFLVARAVVRGDRLVHAVELDDDRTLHHAGFEHPRRLTPREETATRLAHGRTRELYVLGELQGIADGAKGVDPICLGHGHADRVARARNL